MTTSKQPITFRWKGKNQQGKLVRGQRISSSAALLRITLRQQGIIPLQIDPIRNHFRLFSPQFTSIIRILFFQQLSTLLSAGIPLVRALDLVARGQKDASVQQIILSIKEEVASGNNLSHTLAHYPDYFNDLTCALIAAGEQSGSLDIMLNRITLHYEAMLNIKNNLIKIALYPLTVICIAIVVTALLLTMVVPQFENLFASFNAPLPALTKSVISISHFLGAHYGMLLGLFSSIICILVIAWHRSKTMVNYCKDSLFYVPLLGTVLQKSIITRIARTLAITITAGLPLLEGLQLVTRVSHYPRYEQALLNAQRDIASGHSLQHALASSQLFPSLMLQMIAIGEESGTLDKMLSKIADWYDDQINQTIARFSTLLEPIIMVVLAIIVGGLVGAMYLPIFNLGTVI